MRAYLDTSTAIEIRDSNSRLLPTDLYPKFEAIVSVHVIEELMENLKREYGRDFAGYQLYLIREALKPEINPEERVHKEELK